MACISSYVYEHRCKNSCQSSFLLTANTHTHTHTHTHKHTHYWPLPLLLSHMLHLYPSCWLKSWNVVTVSSNILLLVSSSLIVFITEVSVSVAFCPTAIVDELCISLMQASLHTATFLWIGFGQLVHRVELLLNTGTLLKTLHDSLPSCCMIYALV